MDVLIIVTLLSVSLCIRNSFSSETPQRSDATQLAFKLIDSTISRGEGCSLASASTNFIELGIFQQALRESIMLTDDLKQKQRWSECLQQGLLTSASALANASTDVGYPLDRLSIGTNMIHHISSNDEGELISAIKALQHSVVLQRRNVNDGLWYYDNLNNLTYYRNLSYLDGMYSYAPFATLSTLTADVKLQPSEEAASSLDLQAVWKQLQILVSICQRPSGLLVHGYDAIKAHTWANPVTGASPIVWCRAQAWFTLGVLESLEALHHYCLHWPGSMRSSTRLVLDEMKALFNHIILAQVEASEQSFYKTGTYGVWQVVDQPGKTQNFIEASSSSMTVYSLLKGAHSGLLDPKLAEHAGYTAKVMYRYVQDHFLIQNNNGTLSFNGTSSVASLSGDVDYEVGSAPGTTLLRRLRDDSIMLLGQLS